MNQEIDDGIATNGNSSSNLFGRRDIYTLAERITAENVLEEVNNAMLEHAENVREEDYLYWYRRGKQPIQQRTKEIRPEICANIVCNVADEITSFKNGYFLNAPAFYVARSDDKSDAVRTLNDYLCRSGKHHADNKIVNNFHTMGKGVLYVSANEADNDGEPIKAFSLDPRQAFVVYSYNAGNRPVFAVNTVADKRFVYADVVTRDKKFRLRGMNPESENTHSSHDSRESVGYIFNEILFEEPNYLEHINIIEYRYKSTNMGAFENVIDLCNALNLALSDRQDSNEQTIQDLLVITNGRFLEEDISANKIRQRGMLLLESYGDNKTDIKTVGQQLNQTETQVYVDCLKREIYSIAEMPVTSDATGKSTSDSGTAVLARSGWYHADTSARNTEDLFLESNRQFDEILIFVLKKKGLIPDIDVHDFDLRLVKNETIQIQSKAQAFNSLMTGGLHPELALEKSGVSNDPVGDYEKSKEWFDRRWVKDEASEGDNPDVNDTSKGYVQGYWR